MKVKKIKLYEFDELSKEGKEKAIENLRDINVNYEGWHDFFIENWKNKLEDLGYDEIEILYTGFSSQGDGACFTADVNIEKWIEKHKAKTRFKNLIRYLDKGFTAEIVIKHNYQYYYSNSTSIEDFLEGDCPAKAEEEFSELTEWISQEREDLGDEIYRDLERGYFYLMEDEAVIDAIKANEYMFTANGKLENL